MSYGPLATPSYLRDQVLYKFIKVGQETKVIEQNAF